MIGRLSRAKPWLQTTAAILSFGISLLAFWFFLGNLPIALIIMMSIALHELCHLVAARLYGVKSGIIFLTFFAFTYYTNIDWKTFKWDKLSKSVWVTSAGLIGSCALGLILLGLRGVIDSWFIEPVAVYLLLTALINLYLTLTNLAPAGGFDGAKIVSAVMYCFSEEREKAAVLFLTLAELLAIAGTLVLLGFDSFIGMLVILFFGLELGSKIRLARQPLQPTPEGLTKDEAMMHALVYFGLVVLTLFGLWLLPANEIASFLLG